MTLREMMIERIMMCVTEEDLAEIYQTTEIGLTEMSDEDLLDLYDDLAMMV